MELEESGSLTSDYTTSYSNQDRMVLAQKEKKEKIYIYKRKRATKSINTSSNYNKL